MAGRTGGRGRGLPGRRTLVAVEAILIANALKDYVLGLVRNSGLQNWVKVLFVMAITVGLFAGLFVLLERLTRRTVATTHGTLRRMGPGLPMILIHAALLLVLFLVYARQLGLSVP